MRLASITGAAVLLFALSGSANAQQLPLVVNSIELTGAQLVNGVLTATGTVTGTLAGRPFTTDITNLALNLLPSNSADCAVLDLDLAPISLRLLGLHVDTSPICLDIIAIPNGGLLGSLLCSLTGLDVGGILSGLLSDVPVLGGGSLLGTIVEQVLNGALNNSQQVAPGQGGGGGNSGSGDSVCTGDCEILDLVLGPVNLTLLGLNVVLDDCSGGSVEVCVSSTRSEGILGSLLCSLAGPQLSGISLGDISQLIGLAQQLLQDGVLSNADVKQLRQLLQQLL